MASGAIGANGDTGPAGTQWPAGQGGPEGDMRAGGNYGIDGAASAGAVIGVGRSEAQWRRRAIRPDWPEAQQAPVDVQATASKLPVSKLRQVRPPS